MRLFHRKEKESRSIDDILTPKSESEKEAEQVEGDFVSEEAEVVEGHETMCENVEGFTDNALNCFGWKDIKTEKWLIKCAKIWYGIMSFLWFLIGAFTFAPIIFISSKINVIFKNKKKSIFIASVIYAVIFVIIVFLLVARLNGFVTP